MSPSRIVATARRAGSRPSRCRRPDPLPGALARQVLGRQSVAHVGEDEAHGLRAYLLPQAVEEDAGDGPLDVTISARIVVGASSGQSIAPPPLDQQAQGELAGFLRCGFRSRGGFLFDALLSRVNALGDVAGQALDSRTGLLGRDLAVPAERLPPAASILEPQLDEESDVSAG